MSNKDWEFKREVFQLKQTIYSTLSLKLKLEFIANIIENEKKFLIQFINVEKISNFGGFDPEIKTVNYIYNFEKKEFNTLKELSNYFKQEIVDKHLENLSLTSQRYLYGKKITS